MRLAALVTYDGMDFKGFQRQAAERGRTVQGCLEAALARLTGVATTVEGAGRTDSGVHASGQVVTFSSDASHRETTWLRALNALLPADIAVRAVRRVDDGVHARKSALTRSYRYRILCDPVRAPLRERYAWRVHQRLDVAAMQAAIGRLLGEHDFGAFGSSPRDSRTDGYRGHTVRTLLQAECDWRKPEGDEPPDEVECRLTANAFLTGMVRRLVGTLALVGAGRLSVDDFQRILEARAKAHPGILAPAQGLCLTGVHYPAGLIDWGGAEDVTEMASPEDSGV
ncbi:MAG TPA: tRNA pseudouridine(38-40) synthase TruA [Ktedonobacterales bacterium]|nr:tRNA pseudouridine(38-40) synthase TruA [Ktedonobacterales bacterium]